MNSPCQACSEPEPFTATELRMQYDTLERMTGQAYKIWHAISMKSVDGPEETLADITDPVYVARCGEAMRDYERLRAWRNATLEAYHAASDDDDPVPRQGW